MPILLYSISGNSQSENEEKQILLKVMQVIGLRKEFQKRLRKNEKKSKKNLLN